MSGRRATAETSWHGGRRRPCRNPAAPPV